jgi:hypothetical protein
MFVWILFMFRATLRSSSGGQLYEYNFLYNHSVLVAVRYAGQDSSWGWSQGSSKHVDDSNKHIIEEIVRQVVYLPEKQSDTSELMK